ncbi:MAG TPA: phytoene desaturase family protein, partial [Dermatophilaceae bacterium]|nr:phytoene desaturase family protein [Dermatophilaceae bacterium]
MRAVVVGAGLAGLSAAMHLRGAGCEVTVLEQSPTPGGLAAPVLRRGYRLDTGPTVLTMPGTLHSCFGAVGQDLDDWLTLHRLDPTYRAEFADGTGLSVSPDLDLTVDRVAELAGSAQARGFRRYLDHVTELYRLQIDTFIDANLDSPLDLVGIPLLRLVARHGFARLAPTVARYVSDPRLQRVLTFQALYVGVAPARALAAYGVVTSMDLVGGVYYPRGGMSAVPTALAAAATQAGVEVVCGAAVSAVKPADGGRGWVATDDGRRWPADAVVLTCDPDLARGLLGADAPARPIRRSPSCVVLAAGLRRETRSPGDPSAHHMIHFGRRWNAVFDDLDQGRLMADPSFLVSLPTVTDPGLAPPAGGTAYLLFPAPNL